ncbi:MULTISPECIES: SH3 domain-containing protein [Nostocales]|uniref:Peptide-binding protein n=3 Tax=Nostocales TaxID=1161 RepID=A0A0C1N5N0_9CYAN|nr:SH3 domain-containing protein [Tolypothrix bouteillei]KAF3888676.1 SH3 domain-containing protein [Tolypothrix bouteillei VB521301]
MIGNIFKFILGISLALAILVGGGVATALYFMNRTSTPPPKPIFANDLPTVKGKNPKAVVSKSTAKKSNSQPETKAETSADSTPDPTESPKAKEEAPKKLPPGAYRARVTWPQGLSLRAEAQTEAERIGGVGFNSRVIVLQENGGWQRIRIVGSDQEGWVKTGNTQKVNEQEDSEQAEQTPEQ